MREILYIDTGEYKEREAVFNEADAGKRLDAALVEKFPDLSRNRIQILIEGNCVKPPGLTKNSKVKAGEKVVLLVNEREKLSAAPEDIPIKVVYEDEDVIVVDKERGMVVHPAKGNTTGTLVNALLWYQGQDNGDGSVCPARKAGQTEPSPLSCVPLIEEPSPLSTVRPGIVHRIDKNTSGLLVVSKNDEAHAALAAQFADHSITRRYMAIVIGGFSEEEGTIDAPLGRDPKNRLRQAMRHDGKRAVTHWRVIERLKGYTFMELTLETGRTHQIRAHMAMIGHPVLGDDLYGIARGPAANEGQYLHAIELGFDHPKTGERIRFESPLPRYFIEMLEKLQ